MDQPGHESIQYPMVATRPEDGSIIDAVFCYRPADPLAIEVAFTDPSGDATRWGFARDLIHDCLYNNEHAGMGDVRFTPTQDGETVGLTLDSTQDGIPNFAVLSLPFRGLCEFFRQTEEMVPMDSKEEGDSIRRALDDTLRRLYQQ